MSEGRNFCCAPFVYMEMSLKMGRFSNGLLYESYLNFRNDEKIEKGGILVMLAVMMGTATISCSYSNGIMSNGTIDTGNLHL